MPAAKGTPDAVRQGWLRLRKRLGAGWWVAPVLPGDDGQDRYPTGSISVRFGAAVADEALAALCRSTGLRLLHRTRFSDRQAVFLPEDADGYLPDIVQRAADQPGVVSAWADAESRYTRAR